LIGAASADPAMCLVWSAIAIRENNVAEEQALTKSPMAWPMRVKDYFEELQLEMKRVTWPTWPQVRATTGVVIFAVFAFAAYFAVVDTIVGRLIQKLFDTFTK
jgi:preprotein translocase subunit SecE